MTMDVTNEPVYIVVGANNQQLNELFDVATNTIFYNVPTMDRAEEVMKELTPEKFMGILDYTNYEQQEIAGESFGEVTDWSIPSTELNSAFKSASLSELVDMFMDGVLFEDAPEAKPYYTDNVIQFPMDRVKK